MIATAIIFFSLGLDTLAVSLGLGLSGLPRSRWVRVGLTFALCEGLMPVVGLLIGQRLGTLFGEIAGYIAAGILVVIGGLEIREAVMDDDDDEPMLTGEKQRPLLLIGLSVSLDELAVGFALGVLHVPLGPALAYIAVQAFVLTFVGLLIGRRLGGHFGERAELAAGLVLALLGVALFVSELTGTHFV
ncbi:MAG: manganese efflux pump MntP family protein [Chloroflexota bacterium]|nr:manganese efflux pump MntP family protein [Chloroflexota bacterium]MDQ6906986.1 manganese efflux pump MntP family protein [Chloroflexota bacterium]